jgi:hypothetical protein
MEVKSEHKHHPRTDHKHCSRDDNKGKKKSERRPRKSGGHKKKERAMVAGATDIDSSSCYSSSSLSDEKRNDARESGRARTSTSCALPPEAFAAWHIAPQARRATRMKDDSGSELEEEVNNDPSFLIVDNAGLNNLLDNHDDVLRQTNKEKREYRSLLGRLRRRWLS